MALLGTIVLDMRWTVAVLPQHQQTMRWLEVSALEPISPPALDTQEGEHIKHMGTITDSTTYD